MVRIWSAVRLIIGLNYVFAIIINMFLSEVTNDQNEPLCLSKELMS